MVNVGRSYGPPTLVCTSSMSISKGRNVAEAYGFLCALGTYELAVRLQTAQSCRKPYLNVWPSHTYSYVGIPVWNVVDHQFLFYDDLHVMVAFTLTHVDGLSIYGFNGAPDHMGMSLLHSPP